ncbi:MAG: translocation/assembly module TamB domain-containing protein [Pseudomonadota bacterium]
MQRGRKRRIALFFGGMFAVGLVILSAWLPIINGVARGLMIAELSRRLDAKVSVSRFDLSIFPPRVGFEGLEIRKEKGPLREISVGAVRIEPGMGPIFLGEVSIRRVEIEDPTLRIDLTDETPTKRTASRGRFRIPTLNDLIRLEVEEIQIVGANLALRLPGENLRVEIGSGTASYAGGGRNERWSWQGTGRVFRGRKELRLDQVAIVADRSGQDVTIRKFEASGLGATLNLSGEAYPEADLLLQIRGQLEPIEHSLLNLGLLPRSYSLGGAVGAEGRVKGNWDSLAWSGEFRGSNLRAVGRAVRRLAFSFRVNRRTIEAASGEADFGGPIVRFSAGELRTGVPGNFELNADQVPFADIQKLIDPKSAPKLSGAINLSVTGKIGWKPWSLSAAYAVTSPRLSLFISEVMQPYLPLTFREVDVRGTVSGGEGRAYRIENGTVRMDGVEGTYGFEIDPKGAVHGNWLAQIARVAGVFPEHDGVSGRGQVGGGLVIEEGVMRARLEISLDPFRYLSHPVAAFTGTVILEKGWNTLSDFRFRVGSGLMKLEGRIPNDMSNPGTIEGSFSDFDLGWISDTAARRFPLWGGVTGTGSGQVSLSGSLVTPNGVIRLDSRQAAWRGESFDRVDGLIDLERGAVIVQKADATGGGMTAAVRGVVAPGAFDRFQVDTKRFPLSIVSVPAFLLPLISHVDAHVVLDGDTSDPRIAGDLRVFRHDADGKAKGVGRGRAGGVASNLSWNVELEGDGFQASGKIDARTGKSFEGSGVLKKFPITSIVPASAAFVTADWNLRADPTSRKSWNGEIRLHAADLEQGEWKIGLAESTTVKVRDGTVRLDSGRLVGSGGEFQADAIVGADNSLSGHGNGSLALRLLTLFPLHLTRAEGKAEVDAKLGGTLAGPLFHGKLKVSEGYLQFKGFPHPIESIGATAAMEQRRIFFDRIDAQMAGGKVHASGEVLLGTANNPARATLNGDVERVTLRFPPWIPATVSGPISLSGPLSRPLFRGNLAVSEARYQDNWDWQSRILSLRRTVRIERVHREEEEHIRFDLLFRSEGNNFLLRNNLATAKMRGELRLVGSDLGLGLLGKVEVLEGTVVFLDNQFQLSPGLVTFDREDSIHLQFDLNAKTRVQTTNIFLELRTEKENVIAFLSSQPAKDETSIIALLTLGVDTDELTAAGAKDQSLSSSVLPTVFSGGVQSRVESGLKKAKLVDTFQFVPYFSQDTKTSGLKMIVGKQLLPKVRLLYSTDLFDTSADNTLKLEQRFNDHVSLQGSIRDNQQQTTNQEYDLGLDFEFKFEF